MFDTDCPVFRRWQIVCKHAPRLSSADLARGMGLMHTLRSDVVIVSTGEIGPEARLRADPIMRDTNLAVVTIDGQDLHSIAEEPSRIADVLSREGAHATELKTLV